MTSDYATVGQKRELSSRLAFLYLEKADIPDLSPVKLAEKYFEVKAEIEHVVDTHL